MQETIRGFSYDVFNDAKGTLCSVQDSSANGSYIWFGVKKIEPIIETPDGLKPITHLHLKSGKEVDLKLHENYILWNDRMHLSQANVSKIIVLFEAFKNNEIVKSFNFKDKLFKDCSIQVDGNYIKLGHDNPEPQICMNGWRELFLPENAIVVTHMFLSVKEVDMLLPLLKTFVKTGSISD